MKRLSLAILSVLVGLGAYAGNPDRSGQAGAYELLINPYAKSSGMHSLNTAGTRGAQAMRLNVAGLAGVNGSEVTAARGLWMMGSGIGINNVSFAKQIGDSSAFGIEIMNFDFGTIDYTTYDNPEGNIGTFRPSFVNIALSYAQQFSDEIAAGITLRTINESIGNASASGVAIDAGVTYETGKYDNFRFGVALRNIGTPIKYDGDGLSLKTALGNNLYEQTVQQRANTFELPSLMHIGLAYDFMNATKAEELDKKTDYRLTGVFNFQSNSFTNDELGLGLEFSYAEILTLRSGYRWSKSVLYLNSPESSNVYSGLAVGGSILIPTNSDKEEISGLSLDYSLRMTNTYKGVHMLGVTMNF